MPTIRLAHHRHQEIHHLERGELFLRCGWTFRASWEFFQAWRHHILAQWIS